MIFFDRNSADFSAAFRDMVEEMFGNRADDVREHTNDIGTVALYADHSVAVWHRGKDGMDLLDMIHTTTNEHDALHQFGQSVAALDFASSVLGEEIKRINWA